MDLIEFWKRFWSGFDSDPDEIDEIEGVIFRNIQGEWFAAMVSPNATGPNMVQVYFDPWTGEELK